jgi:lauroyl/myristoyl acyltransferase
MAFHAAGIPVSHLSRVDHGFSASRFGTRFLNPICTKIEDRFLAERLLIKANKLVGPLRELPRRLRDNGLISITVGAGAQQVCAVPFMNGQIRLATGPLNLAFRTGAPLLPVFSIHAGSGGFITRIEPPIEVPKEVGFDEAAMLMASRYADVLTTYVTRWPNQFRAWYDADPPGEDQPSA